MKHHFTFLVLFILIGCSSSLTPVDDGLQKQIFHFGNGSEPQGIDPHIVTGVPEHHILISLCEGLTIPSPYVMKIYLELQNHGPLVMMERVYI